MSCARQPDNDDERILCVRFKRALASLPESADLRGWQRQFDGVYGYDQRWRVCLAVERAWHECLDWTTVAEDLNEWTLARVRGLPAAEAALSEAVSENALRKYRRLHGENPETGHADVGISDRDRRIVEMAREGTSQRAIASRFGITQPRVCSILAGR